MAMYLDGEEVGVVVGATESGGEVISYIKGEADPTSDTIAEYIGQEYVNVQTGSAFKCKAITSETTTVDGVETTVTTYTWEKIILQSDLNSALNTYITSALNTEV